MRGSAWLLAKLRQRRPAETAGRDGEPDDATAYLLRSPANAWRLRVSIAELEGRKDRDEPDEVDAGLHAHSHALSLLHTEVAEFRQEMGEFRDEMRRELGQVRDVLAELLRRLPIEGPRD